MALKTRLKKKAFETRALVLKGFRNSVKCSHTPGESKFHRDMKWVVCRFLYEMGFSFYTEATFRGGGRADIVVEELGIAFEILHSESIGEFCRKDYPLLTIPVRTKESDLEVEKMLLELAGTLGAVGEFYRDFMIRKYTPKV